MDRTRRGLRHGCRGHAQRHSSAAALAGCGLCHLSACEKWLQFLKTLACPRSPRLPCRLAPALVGSHSQGAQRGCAGQRWTPGHRPPLGGITTIHPAVSRRPGAAFKTGPQPTASCRSLGDGPATSSSHPGHGKPSDRPAHLHVSPSVSSQNEVMVPSAQPNRALSYYRKSPESPTPLPPVPRRGLSTSGSRRPRPSCPRHAQGPILSPLSLYLNHRLRPPGTCPSHPPLLSLSRAFTAAQRMGPKVTHPPGLLCFSPTGMSGP